MIDCDDQIAGPSIESEKDVNSFLNFSNAYPIYGYKNSYNVSDFKVRKWLGSDSCEDDACVVDTRNKAQPNQNKLISINLISSESSNSIVRSDQTTVIYPVRSDEKNISIQEEESNTDHLPSLEHFIMTSQVNKDTRTKESDRKKKIGSSHELKYAAIHAKVHAKNQKKSMDAITDIEKTNDGDDLSTTTNDQSLQVNSANNSTNISVTDKQSSVDATWSRVIEVGKEMRGKKKKKKKLDVTIEKTKKLPKIIENIIIKPSDKDNLPEPLSRKTSNKEADVSNLLQESNDSSQNVIDKSLNVSNAKLKISTSKTKDRRQKTSFTKNNDNSISEVNCHVPEYTMLGEDERVCLKNMSNHQMNDIIGLENFEKESLFGHTNVSNENSEKITMKRCGSPRKRLVIPTPKKFNESINESESSALSVENQIPKTPVNNNARKISGEISSHPQSSMPNKPKLSLRRNLSFNEKDKLPTSYLSVVNASFPHDRKKDTDSPMSKSDSSLNHRLTSVKRDLSLQIDNQTDQTMTAANTFSRTMAKCNENDPEIVRRNKKLAAECTSKKSQSRCQISKDKNKCLVRFIQMGTLLRRQKNVKYRYIGKTKRERSMPAEIPVNTVCNTQQTEMEQDIRCRSCNSVMFSNSSHESSREADVIAKNICSMYNSIANSSAVLKDAGLSAELPPCDVSANSTLKGNTTQDLIATLESPPIKRQLNKSTSDTDSMPLLDEISHTNRNAIHKQISSNHSRTASGIKLLSPDKDSQLKFLSVDSPMSQHKKSKLASLMQQQYVLRKSPTKENNLPEVKSSQFTEDKISSATSSIFVPKFQSGKKRKRRINSDQESIQNSSTSKNDESSYSSDESEHTIKLDICKKSKSDNIIIDSSSTSSNTDRKLNLSSSHNANTKVTHLNSTEKKKFKRIIYSSSSESDAESDAKRYNMKNYKRY